MHSLVVVEWMMRMVVLQQTILKRTLQLLWRACRLVVATVRIVFNFLLKSKTFNEEISFSSNRTWLRTPLLDLKRSQSSSFFRIKPCLILDWHKNLNVRHVDTLIELYQLVSQSKINFHSKHAINHYVTGFVLCRNIKTRILFHPPLTNQLTCLTTKKNMKLAG